MGESEAEQVNDRLAELVGSIREALDALFAFERTMVACGELRERRESQALAWLWSEISEQLLSRLKADASVAAALASLEPRVRGGELPAAAAAERVVSSFLDAAAPVSHSSM